jgi:surface antigen
MRIAVITGVFACAVIFVANTNGVEAMSTNNPEATVRSETIGRMVAVAETTKSPLLNNTEETEIVLEVTELEPEKEEVIVKHIVLENETLSKIAKQYNVSWKRIYDKNTQIENQDVISVGQEIIIPSEVEVLESRVPVEPEPLPVVATVSNSSTTPQRRSQPASNSASVASTARGSSDGNRYVAGYCTWYVKNRRPDLPNNLGNASTWVSRAAAQGLATGSTPRVGAVGQQGNHVVYIESVNGDGTVTVSDMNWSGLYVITTRTVPASNFSYIY